MLFDAPRNPSGFKKIVYLIATTILGVLLGSIICGLLEINYLKLVVSSGNIASFNNGYALLKSLQLILLMLGAVGGLFMGRFWWRKVYIERVWAQRYRRK